MIKKEIKLPHKTIIRWVEEEEFFKKLGEVRMSEQYIDCPEDDIATSLKKAGMRTRFMQRNKLGPWSEE